MSGRRERSIRRRRRLGWRRRILSAPSADDCRRRRVARIRADDEPRHATVFLWRTSTHSRLPVLQTPSVAFGSSQSCESKTRAGRRRRRGCSASAASVGWSGTHFPFDESRTALHPYCAAVILRGSPRSPFFRSRRPCLACDGSLPTVPASSVGLHAGPATNIPQRERLSVAEPPSHSTERPSAGSRLMSSRSIWHVATSPLF